MDYHLGQNKMEQLSPFPPNNGANKCHFGITEIEERGEGGPDVPFFSFFKKAKMYKY